MATEAVSTDAQNVATYTAPASLRRAPVGSASFSNTLARTSISSGSADLDAIFEEAGRRYNLSPNLLKAVARVESNFRADAVSRAGAMGVMQLMPGTAAGLGVTDAFDPEQNIMGGAKYLRQMLDRFDGDIQAALSAYNAGPGRVSKNGGKALSFTEGYVSKVLRNFNGGDITAGMVSYGRPIADESASSSGGLGGLLGFSENFTQMLLIKIIEMQMNSMSSSDKDERIF